MKERPILFSAPMVRALLAGTKTQTRRVVKPSSGPHTIEQVVSTPDSLAAFVRTRCPYGSPAPLTLRPIQSTGGTYMAGDDGRIYRDGKPLKPWRGGYEQQYEMVSAGDQRKAYVHRLVCEAFYGPSPEALPEVRHLDGEPSNNRPENLDWGTKEQNAADRTAHGRASGEAHHDSRLSEADVAAMRTLRTTMTRPALAERFGVSKGTVDDILDGRTWTQRKAPSPNMPRYQRQPGDRLWVREAFRCDGKERIAYRADGRCGSMWPADEGGYRFVMHGWLLNAPGRGDALGPSYGEQRYGKKWTPSIHMPRWASRITLEVVAVRVERLQDISEADAKAEGLERTASGKQWRSWQPQAISEHGNPQTEAGHYDPRPAYRWLLDHINGAGAWDANPWVWVVEFKRVLP